MGYGANPLPDYGKDHVVAVLDDLNRKRRYQRTRDSMRMAMSGGIAFAMDGLF